MNVPSRLLSLVVTTAVTGIVACGSAASSQGTPIAPPTAGTPTPIASPTSAAPTPIAPPTAGTPTPIASPTSAAPTPVAPPPAGTPVAPPSGPSGQAGATPIAGPSGGPALDARASAILAAHNAHRARHCAPPLRWSPTVAAAAQRYADELAANGCAFRHSSSQYGENLMRFSPAGSRSPAYVADAWYGEVSAYDYSRPGFAMNTGHFTQVVWAGSTELGCGVAVCNGGETWVCNYSPAGNMQGDFPANVRPATCQ